LSVEFGEVENGGWWQALVMPVAMAVVGAIAFTVLVGGVAIREGGFSSAKPSRMVAASEVAAEPGPKYEYELVADWPRMTIYVVGTQDEAWELEAAIASVAMDSMHLQTVYVVDSSEAQVSLIMLQGDVGQFSTETTSIVDLRK
jgi:hypothetical protein